MLAIVSMVGVVLSAVVVLRVYVDNGGDITSFIAFGEEDQVTSTYGRERLGDVFLRESVGHDGRFFFVQANDPLLVDPGENAAILDRPVYRAQRMFYPLLAGGFGGFPPEVIAWALVLVNLAAMGLGTWAVAGIARDMGGSPWWGLAFPLNVGLISEMSIDGAGVVAAAAAFGAIALLKRGRVVGTVGLLVVAALSREATLVVAAGLAFWAWRRQRRRDALVMVVIPTAAVLVWAFYVRLRLGAADGLSEIQEIGWPFVGIARAISGGTQGGLDLAVAVVLLILFVLFVRRALIADSELGWGTVGFVALGLILTEQVWRNYFDITRAVAPVLTAFVLLVFLSSVPYRSSDRSVSTHQNHQAGG